MSLSAILKKASKEAVRAKTESDALRATAEVATKSRNAAMAMM